MMATEDIEDIEDIDTMAMGMDMDSGCAAKDTDPQPWMNQRIVTIVAAQESAQTQGAACTMCHRHNHCRFALTAASVLPSRCSLQSAGIVLASLLCKTCPHPAWPGLAWLCCPSMVIPPLPPSPSPSPPLHHPPRVQPT